MKKLSFYILFIIYAFFFSGCSTTGEKESLITVTQTDRGALITISERILFDSGKYDIKQESSAILDMISEALNERTKKDILIEGHTDSSGSQEVNKALSEKRAEAVRSDLVKRKVLKERIKISGLGSSKPKGDNKTTEGRRINRRVEITILGEQVDNLGLNENILSKSWIKFKQAFS